MGAILLPSLRTTRPTIMNPPSFETTPLGTTPTETDPPVTEALPTTAELKNPEAPAPKSLDITDIEEAVASISDICVTGNGDLFQLLCKASSDEQGWMKSTKAMEVPGGCVVQVTTQQGDNIAEALTFVPNVRILPDVNGGRKLGHL